MSSADPLAVLELNERNQLEGLLMEFDATWQPDSIQTYSERLASYSSPRFRHLALKEFVKVDLQRGWASENGKLLDVYLELYPELVDGESVSAELIVAEYDARASVDPAIDLGSYEARFPREFPAVKELAEKLRDSAATNQSVAHPTRQDLTQASVDTSRVERIRDTKAGWRADTVVELPTEFGRYRILKELGSGAMGKVYLAHDNQLDRQVALKTPSFSGADDQDVITRFYREARAAAKLQHRNICPTYDVGEIDGRHFIAMAFIKGRCMSEFIRPDKLPPQRTSAILVHRLAQALAEAHRHNVIHRDLKPANIMIDLKKEPIVMDFGLARQMDVESRVTQSGMAVGTPAYMSPEQIRGELSEVGTTADIYALGVILYELLTGQLPFRGPIAKVVYGIVHEEPVSPSKVRSSIDPSLEAICARMMAKRRDQRYQSMDEVAAALKAYVKGNLSPSEVGDADEAVPSPSTGQSSSARLTETVALNAFFATQIDTDAMGTRIEAAAKPKPLVQSPHRKLKNRTRRKDFRRKILIGTGFVGGLLFLLGVIIHFKGGTVRLDPDSKAVVKVDSGGNITIHPDPVTASAQPHVQVPAASSRLSTPPLPSAATFEHATIDPKIELLNEWELPPQEKWGLWHLATLSPSGDRVAFRYGSMPLTISETESKQRLEIPAEMEDATSIAFSADGRLIATGHDNKKIRLWKADSFEPVGEPFESPIEPNVLWVHLSTDGTKLIAMANDHAKLKGVSTFLTWEISTRKLISKFQAVMDEQRLSDSIDASADGTRLAVISLRDGATFWDTTTGERLPVSFEIDQKLASMKRITGMDLSVDGSRLAYGVLNGSPSFAAVVDTATGKQLWNTHKQKGRVHCVQFSDDGRWLATTASRTKAHQLSLWNVSTGAEVERWTYPYESESEHADRIKFLSFSEDASRLLLSGGHMPVVVWNLFDKAGTEASDQRTDESESNKPLPELWKDFVDASPEPVGIEETAIDMLARVDLERDVIHGAWKFVDGQLESTPGWFHRLHLPYDVPEQYEIAVDTEGDAGLTFVLLVGGARVVATLDNFPLLGYRSGLQFVDGKDLLKSPLTHVGQILPAGKHQVVVSVREAGKGGDFRILIQVDGKSMIDWTGKPDRLSNIQQFDVPNDAQVAIGSHDGTIRFTKILLTPYPDRGPDVDAVAVTGNEQRTYRATAQRLLDSGARLGFVNTSGWQYSLPEDAFRVNNIEFPAGCATQDSDIALLSHFPELETVTFWQGQVTDAGFKQLGELQSLRIIRFNQGCGVGDQGLAALTKLQNLEHLSVFHTKVTNDGLKALTEMPALSSVLLGTSFHKRFGQAFVTDEGLVHLQGIKNLTTASVWGPLWTDAAGAFIGKMENLQELQFGSPTITDRGIEPLAQLRKLRSLTLLTPQVSDEALASLRQRLPSSCRLQDKRDKDKFKLE